MKSPTTISIIIAILVLVGSSLYLSQKKGDQTVVIPNITNPTSTSTKTNTDTKINNKDNSKFVSSSNVSVVGGVQIINLQVKGGYSPSQTVAKAGIPTTIRFVTDNVFDCSRSVRISSLNISKNLPQTGSTDISIGTQTVGSFKGTCGMGMYPFEVDFQ